MFSPLSQRHNCASTILLVFAESQVEAKIKNDNKQMYLYRSILKKLKYDVDCEFLMEIEYFYENELFVVNSAKSKK